jgi:hypothetical protein
MLPPSITPLSASSIVALGSGVPSVGVNPSSGASTIVPPSGSVGDPTSSITPPGGSSSGIVPPGGSVGGSSGGSVKPLGGKYDATGECVQDKVRRDCTTSKDLMRQSIKLAIKIERGLGTEQDNIDLARNTATLAARETMPDKTADDYVRRLSNSSLYNSLTPKERTYMWVGLTTDFVNKKIDQAGFGDRVYGAENSVVVRDGSGKIIGFTGNGKSQSSSGLDPSLGAMGVFKNTKGGIIGFVITAFSSSTTDPDERISLGAGALLRGIAIAGTAGLTALGVFISSAIVNSHDDEESTSSLNSDATTSNLEPEDPCKQFEINGSNPYRSQTDTQLLDSLSSYESLVSEHIFKIDDFRANPTIRTPGVSPEIAQKQIEGRIRALEKQLSKQRGELGKIVKEIGRRAAGCP